MEKNTRTGYVSIDKPQYKFYRENPIREFDINQTSYQLVFNSNKDNMNYNAVGYFGNYLTYDELKQKVDKAATAYKKIGVKSGDVVAIAMINTPEVPINLLALNKIGAVSKWLDITAAPLEIEKTLNEHNCKIIVCLDKLIPKVNPIINNTNVKQILTVTPADSLSTIQKIGYKIKNKLSNNNIVIPNDKKFIPFSEFVELYNTDEKISIESFNKEKPTVIVQSSGTTGTPKSIVHSDYAINKFVEKISYSDLPLYPKEVLLVVVPPFLAYGLIDSIFLSHAFGMVAELYPKVDPDALYKNLGNFTMSFAAPLHYRYLSEKIDNIKRKDLDKIKCLISGGDKITKEELTELEQILGIKILNGYGNNEGLGAVTFNPYNANKFGTVGIPKYGDEVIIYNPETEKELKYDEKGEICFKTETEFIEYSNNEEETKRVKRTHPDGSRWIHTGDLGSIDSEGYLTIEGRGQRVIVRRAFKISPFTIENVVVKHPAVKECIVVSVPDVEEDNVPLLFYTIKEEYLLEKSKIDKEIRMLCENSLKEVAIPKYYFDIDEIPYTDNNKQDYHTLEKLGQIYVGENKLEALTLKNIKNK